MRFAFSEEQTMLRDSMRALLTRECPPTAVRAAWSSESGRVPSLWPKLADLGVLGLAISDTYGGSGLGPVELVAALEEAGRAALPEPLLETAAVAAPLLCAAGDEDTRQRWLPSIAAGRTVASVRLGDAPLVSYAHEADVLVLQRGDELHAVPRGEFSLEPQRSVDGGRRLFRVAWAPERHTLVLRGPVVERACAEASDLGALAAAAELLGIAQRLLDMTVEYTKVREQFGKPIGSFQAIKHHLADAHVAIAFARPVVYRAAWSVTQNAPDRATHVSMAKAFASDAAALVAKHALQCHGAIGYSFEHDLHLWMKRAWALGAAWGDAATHRARIGNALLGARLRRPDLSSFAPPSASSPSFAPPSVNGSFAAHGANGE